MSPNISRLYENWFDGSRGRGSLADITAALLNVRFTPKAGIIENRRHVR
jgi:hypothetical protein